MRFGQIRQIEQSARQALHRVRDRYMTQRTGLINQIRSFLLEFGIPIRQGAGVFRIDMPRVLGDEDNELPPSMRKLLSDLWSDFKTLESRIEEITQQIQRSVQYSDTARRLMTVPASARLRPVRWRLQQEMAVSFPTADSSPLGSGLCLVSTAQGIKQRCFRSVNEEMAI